MRTFKFKSGIFSVLILVFLLSSCSQPLPFMASATPSPTLTVTPSPTFTPTPTITPTSTPTNTPTESQTILFEDDFSSDGNYDSALWICLDNNACGKEYMKKINGEFNLVGNGYELIDVISRPTWNFSEITSLSGRINISSETNHYQQSWGWISLHDHVAQCTVSGYGKPAIQCSVGSSPDYKTDYYPMQYDTFYTVKMEIDHIANSIMFYLDNQLIGEYSFIHTPEIGQISIGIYGESNSKYYIDDIVLISKK